MFAGRKHRPAGVYGLWRGGVVRVTHSGNWQTYIRRMIAVGDRRQKDHDGCAFWDPLPRGDQGCRWAAEIARQAGIDNVNVNLGCRLAAYVTTDDGVRERLEKLVGAHVL